ncbi:hypothetical protein KUTeg_000147 [Tegillarca granosa]|uniref:Uncharacterized protein n=1 Tax=Tegillarca granosa TaxID=220873 RepID=A0ABQ9FY39_TEGGR|nr:hypothetical protein KUTeg_000147 [Tegillarca granosa]
MEGYVNHLVKKLQEIQFGQDPEIPQLSFVELRSWNFWKGVIGEFVATLLFVYMGVSSTVVLVGSPDVDIVQYLA